MRMLRFTLGKTRLYKTWNEVVQVKLRVSEIGEKLIEARLRWCDHEHRTGEGYVVCGKECGESGDTDVEEREAGEKMKSVHQ